MCKNILLVNPWLYDFAAYDLWSKPLGLLYIAAVLKNSGARVNLIDCLDRGHPSLPEPKSNVFGCGKYINKEIEKPYIFQSIPRKYKRYGISKEALEVELNGSGPQDMILVSSCMTYWYPGVQEVIFAVKKRFPNVPVVLGGVYASLCKEHAEKFSGADHVIADRGLSGLAAIIKKELKIKIDMPDGFIDFPPAFYEIYHKPPGYAVLKTGVGCPFDCSYCAQKTLNGQHMERKPPEEIVSEIVSLCCAGIRNIAFYDDALLFKPEKHINPILEQVTARKLNMFFHTPNGLHARFITPTLAKLLKSAGFVTPRFGLETSDPKKQAETGAKITNEEFKQTAAYLREAGYKKGGYTAYIMLGLPGQDLAEVKKAAKFAHDCGSRVSLSEYSPIPHTGDWEKIAKDLPSDDPLWHNNSIFTLFKDKDRSGAQKVKLLVKGLNDCFT